ncbi:MAG TPA: 16S rRNA (guanine(966)-N(2))-methyltransferase RsmD [Metalysinibacillus jejuensis]|uniref:16S rRNA (Guanine(966)-N(2))-methyltransferase RsmD n=2 Tax=Metalysinibacillus jejuensis TaxID=914327 RepID=A0A921T646_9BACL|nr:16S rRNA (guanine(966)-N(2))-methyltransferase RsmD [Metalysinibacillus jejuensis]HJH11809.1 16S rRNA (guanine(966)-N(2))-methyltransferase RsmD [Metalysinibacillus jejuensis]
MRIVAGERKSIPLKSAAGKTTRPTTDKVKESLFNIIGPYFSGGIALDLFAGSGGLGLETLSRGAERAIFIEKDAKSLEALRSNIEKCRYETCTEVYRNDATRAVKSLLGRNEQYTFVFVDPPYAQVQYYAIVAELVEANKVTDNGVIVCEHDKAYELPEAYGEFICQRREKYGDSIISIYEKGE